MIGTKQMLLARWYKFLYSYVGLMLLVVVGSIIESCGSVDCDAEQVQFRLVSFSADWVRITGEVAFNDQVDLYEVESYQPSSEGIPFDSLAIRTANTIDGISLNRDTKGSWGLNSLMACSPATSFEALEDVEIISDINYDAAHPAGTNLNDIISIRRATFKDGLPIPSVILGFEVDNQDLLFTFDKAPDQSLSHNLSITYVLLDGRRLSQSLAEVLIVP
ncbi:MAG: hypothetical protein RIC80_20805 [Cyclobacteriaceae bacterium]